MQRLRKTAVRAGARLGALVVCGLLASGPMPAAQTPPAADPANAGDAAAEAAGPRPKLQIVDREVDLGKLHRGDKAEARFELRNVGDEVLRIQRVKPG
jgi:hypothetical protein